jgi:hypothetical protein
MAKKKNIPGLDSSSLRVGMRVLLKKNFRLAIVEKIHPKYSDEFVVSYYDEHNKLCYDIITERDVLPADDYEKIKERNNRINDILRDD